MYVAVVGCEHEVELVPAGQVHEARRAAHLGADVLRIAGLQRRIVTEPDGLAVLPAQPVRVPHAQSDRERVLLRTVGLERLRRSVLVEGGRDLRQVDAPKRPILRMGHGARRDRVEGAVRGVGPERVLQGV